MVKKKTLQPQKNSQKQQTSGNNREVGIITYAFLAIFVAMMLFFAYFQFFQSEQFINSSYNKRQDEFARRVVRGDILSADGQILATTVTDSNGAETRSYPYGSTFAHVVGYSSTGKTGIESIANFNLLRSNTFFAENIANDLQGDKNLGDDVITTLNTTLQETAYDALGRHDGAVIVMEPATGKILAMVSKPDYDPNELPDEWDELVAEDSTSSVLVNRATQGLYPPGSTFKILTTLEYIHENPDYEDYTFTCKGSYTVGNKTIHCYNNERHGTESLEESFAESCNSSYASLGLTLDLDSFQKLCDGMLFNTALPTTFESSSSSFSLKNDASDATIMETAIGQGETLVTPFHMALLTCAIANDGVLMNPYVLDYSQNSDGAVVQEFKPSTYGQLMTASDAKILQTYMEEVVQTGTGKKLNGQSYTAAGKTGSAEFSSNSSSHAWFTGYASLEGYEDIAVVVLVEDSGSGSEYAVPIAKEIFDAYFDQE